MNQETLEKANDISWQIARLQRLCRAIEVGQCFKKSRPVLPSEVRATGIKAMKESLEREIEALKSELDQM